MRPDEFARKINEWARATMIESHGTRFLTAGEGRAVAQLDRRLVALLMASQLMPRPA